MASIHEEQQLISPNQIVFWGPPKSGKTWLFMAFLKKVQLIDKKLEKEGFHFYITANGKEVGHIETLNMGPTADYKAIQYKFLRRKTDGQSINVNIQNHEILVIDNTGGAFDGSDIDENKKAFALESVRTARFLVLSLNSGYDENASTGTIVRQLRDLCKIVEDGNNGKKIAACLTKVDTLGEELVIEYYNRDKSQIRGLLIRSFGRDYVDQIYEGLESLKMNGRNQVELFATSATGYMQFDGKKSRNISGNVIADPAQWDPEEVEKPFFWLFDLMEHERLHYIPDEKDLFSAMMGKKTVAEVRDLLYIPYSRLSKMANAVKK